jgi:hypothetical protein
MIRAAKVTRAVGSGLLAWAFLPGMEALGCPNSPGEVLGDRLYKIGGALLLATAVIVALLIQARKRGWL